MSKRLKPADRHITRAECQALIVHTLNQIFSQGERPEACPDCTETGPCSAHAPKVQK